jgi:hypothetical protein
MNIIFRYGGQIIIDDVTDIIHVQPTRRDIGSHQHFEAAPPKTFKGRSTLWEPPS